LAAPAHACLHRSRLQLLNLVAALHHQLGKHNVAALYLATALAQHQQVQEQQQQHASPQQAPDGSNAAQQTRWLLPDASDALSFNLGLQQLALHDWQAALHYFEAASGKYFTQPQLWLRLAEACLGLYRTQQQQQQHQQQQQPGSRDDQRQQECAFLLQQAAAHLDTGLTLLQGQQEAASKQLEAAAAATAAAIAAGESPPLLDGPPWLAAAAAAAAAAAHSGGVLGQPGTPVGLSVADTGDTAGSSSAAAAAAALLSSLPPGETLEPRMAAVKQSLLANQAFAALELEQPQQALAAAQALLGCSSMSPHLHYLGSSYAAEALCLLERPQEAAHVLQDHLSLFSGHEAAASGGDERLAAAAASIKSDDDGSCKSCSRGTCMHSSCAAGHGYSHHGHSLQPGAHAAMLHNLSAVMQLMALQGNAAAGVGGPLGPQHQL
jgi:CCR4-NOT transcription complex subunit 10